MLDIQKKLLASACKLREAAASLIQFAEQMERLDLAQELLVNASEIFKKLLEQDRANADQVKTLTDQNAALQSQLTDAESRAISAEDLQAGEDFLNAQNPATPPTTLPDGTPIPA
jgi:hypothetical protein